jgi:hypothetical protein
MLVCYQEVVDHGGYSRPDGPCGQLIVCGSSVYIRWDHLHPKVPRLLALAYYKLDVITYSLINPLR